MSHIARAVMATCVPKPSIQWAGERLFWTAPCIRLSHAVPAKKTVGVRVRYAVEHQVADERGRESDPRSAERLRGGSAGQQMGCCQHACPQVSVLYDRLRVKTENCSKQQPSSFA